MKRILAAITVLAIMTFSSCIVVPTGHYGGRPHYHHHHHYHHGYR